MTPTLRVAIAHGWGQGFELDVDVQSASSCVALTGPSGAGKSTVLACIAGLVSPRRATIQVGERVLDDTARGVRVPPRKRRIGLVLQDAWLFPLMSVRRNLLYGHVPGAEALSLDRAAELLEIGHLLDRSPRNLSGGERQRVALGRALLSAPTLLLCDEPLSALDAPRRDRLLEVLVRVRDNLAVPIVLVTHDPVVLGGLATEVIALDRGRVVSQAVRAVPDQTPAPSPPPIH